MSTPETNSPVSDLMQGLGINPEESNPVMEEESNSTTENELTDSEAATLEQDADQSEPQDETDTVEADTDTSSEMEQLKAELEKLNKRISDKDKYINELRQQKEQETVEETVSEDEDSFFDDPEGKFKDLVNQLRIANLRIDEQAYAAGKADYWDVVSADSIQDAFRKDATFMEEFNASNRPYEVAYNYLSEQKTAQTKSQQELRDSIRAEIMAELGADKPKRDVPPSINNVGKSPSGVSEAHTDGFSAVFG